MNEKKFYRKGEKVFLLGNIFFIPLVAILHLFPRRLCEWFFELFKNFPGLLGIGVRYVFLKRLAKKVGNNIAIFGGVSMINLKNAEFGSHISIHSNVFIDADALVMGSDVAIAHASSIFTGKHLYNTDLPIREAVELAPVHIGDNVWIGAGVRILGGITIGSNVVVGANSVVNKIIPSNVVVAGVPAKIIKEIE